MSNQPFVVSIEVDKKAFIQSIAAAKQETVDSTGKMQSEFDALTQAIKGGAVESFKEMRQESKKAGSVTKQSAKETRASGQRMAIGLDGVLESFQLLGSMAQSAFQTIVEASPAASVALAQMKFQTTLIAKEFGDALAPILRIVADLFRELTEIVSVMPETFKIFIGVLIAFIAVGAVVAATITAITTVSAPLIVAILAISAVVALLYVAWESNFLGIQEITASVFAVLEEVFVVFKDAAIAIFDILKNAFDEFSGESGGSLEELMAKFQEMWEFISPILKQLFEVGLGIALSYIEFFVNQAFDYIGFLIEVFSGLVDIVMGLLTGDWQRVFDGAAGIFQAFVDYVFDTFNNVIDFLSGFFDAIGLGDQFEAVVEFLSGPILAVLDVIRTAWNDFLDVLQKPLDTLKNWDLVPDHIKDIIPDLSGFKIDSFHSGGQFKAPPGKTEGVALLQDEEFVLQPSQLQALVSGGGTGGMGITSNRTTNQERTVVNIYNPSFRNSRDLDDLAKKIKERDYRSMRRQTFTRS